MDKRDMEGKSAAREKAKAVAEELRSMKPKEAAKKVEDGIEETLTYCEFPSEHWICIRTNNVIERLNREIRRRTRVVGSFPDGTTLPQLRPHAGRKNPNVVKKFPIQKRKPLKFKDLSGFSGADRQIRTADLILTKRLWNFFLTIFRTL